MEGPLSKVRVLSLGNYLAGPVAAMIMGDLGAEVIKIEPPQGDLSRLTAGPNHKGESSHFLSWNRNKKGIVLDLRTESGKEAFEGLVKISDVVLNNFRPGVMKRLGADYEALKNINPRIICINLSGMGTSGPYSDRPAVESTASGASHSARLVRSSWAFRASNSSDLFSAGAMIALSIAATSLEMLS